MKNMIIPYNAEICLSKPWRPNGFFQLPFSASFEDLCYGSTTIINISVRQVPKIMLLIKIYIYIYL